ncbi:hypothetical protein MMC31_007434 [Peltigera leucophlebia]|nr:hypothetical protein [Peltigera leucophlebia]
MDWLDTCIENERTTEDGWNDYWNNHLRFCKLMELYMSLCYTIKFGDTGLLRHIIREICIILQAPLSGKPKYARAMLRQIPVFDTEATDPILQEAYLANALVNLRGLPHTFYEMDLLLEHQNGKFKRFRANRRSSLQETDQMFWLHALSVDSLRKVRSSMNKIIIGREKSGLHREKNASFDILSLADQLYRSKSTCPKGLECGKIYFAENQAPDLLKQGLEAFLQAATTYNDTVLKNRLPDASDKLDGPVDGGDNTEDSVEFERINERVNELFDQAGDKRAVIADLSELYL